MGMQRLIGLILLLLTVNSSGQNFSLYLIGDAGHAAESDSAIKMLHAQLSQESSNAAVIFLGDNVYPRGLYPEKSSQRAQGEAQLLSQFKATESFSGQVYFIPGNHDWRKSRWNGLSQIKQEQLLVEERLPEINRSIKNPESCFLPEAGFPGPAVVMLDSVLKLKLVVIDLQWWLQQQFFHRVGKEEGLSKKETEREFLDSVETILSQSESNGEKIIIAAHHPLISSGQHSELDQPLHSIVTYVPPLQLFRLAGLNRLFRQDIPSHAYSKIANSVFNIMQKHKNIIYTSGHDHNLQLFYEEKLQNIFIVSGAGSSHVPFVQDTSTISLFKEDCCEGFFKITFNQKGVNEIMVFTTKNPEGFYLRKKWNNQ